MPRFPLVGTLADKLDKAVGGDAALEVGIELRADIVGERSFLRLAGGDAGVQMLLDDPVAGNVRLRAPKDCPSSSLQPPLL